MRSMLAGLATVLALTSFSTALAGAKDRAPPETELAKMLEGRTAGEPVDCINQRSIASVKIIDKTAVVYQMPGGALYVNRPAGAAFLDRDAALVTNTIGSRLCRMDIVNLIDPGMSFSHGSVSLNAFVPYAKPRP